MVSDQKAKLAGTKSARLFDDIDSMDDLDRSERILKFFQGLDG